MKTPFHSKNCSFQTLGGHTGNSAASALRFLMFLILCSVAISGCRKETDEFLYRPFSNGKVFIQIGGRKWMIDDSYPSFFSSDNKGMVDAPRGKYVTEETVNGNMTKVVSFVCESERDKSPNIACQLILTYSVQGGTYTIKSAEGYASAYASNPDSIFYSTKTVYGSLKEISRLNYCWHEGEIVFEGKSQNPTINRSEKIIIKFIFKS